MSNLLNLFVMKRKSSKFATTFYKYYCRLVYPHLLGSVTEFAGYFSTIADAVAYATEYRCRKFPSDSREGAFFRYYVYRVGSSVVCYEGGCETHAALRLNFADDFNLTGAKYDSLSERFPIVNELFEKK